MGKPIARPSKFQVHINRWMGRGRLGQKRLGEALELQIEKDRHWEPIQGLPERISELMANIKKAKASLELARARA